MSKRTLMWISAAAVAAVLTYVVFFPQPYKPMERPDEQSFHGRWMLDAASVPSAKKRTGKTPADALLAFHPDGRVSVKDMPYQEGSTRLPEFALLTGEGRWELQLQQDWVMAVYLDERRSVIFFIDMKDGRPAGMSYGVSDPDSSERWIWRRAP